MNYTLFPVRVEFCSIASGSSGNCYYVGNGEEGFLVDAGVSVRRIRKALGEIGRDISAIKGVFITHAHIDHISGLTLLTRKYGIPVYGTAGTIQGILRNRRTFDVDTNCLRTIHPLAEIPLSNFSITAFPTSHDAHDAVGYSIVCETKRIVIATDLGHICQNVSPHLCHANLMVVEANYDYQMLINGPYPYELQQRIHSHLGHLDNRDAADFVARNFHQNLTHILLGHLSQHNNSPERALETFHEAFRENSVDISAVTLHTLPRHCRSEVYLLD